MPMLTTSVKRAAVGGGDRAVADAVGEGGHAVEHGVDLGHHVLAVDEDRRAGAVAQRGVQDGAVLGDVDRVAAEHRVAPLGHAARLGELDQQRQRAGVERGLGEVEQHVAEPRPRRSWNRSRVALGSGRAAGLPAAALPASSSCLPDRVGHRAHPFSWLASRASCSTSSHSPASSRAGVADPGAADAEHVRQRQVVGGVLRR